MKRTIIAFSTSLTLVAQTLVLPTAFAQSGSSSEISSSSLCQVSASMKTKLSSMLNEEKAKTARVQELSAEIGKAIEKDNSKDGIKKVLRIASAVLYLLDGDLEGFSQSVTGSIIAGSEDANDMKALTDAQVRVKAAVQRQASREAAINSILSTVDNLDCSKQAQVLATALNQIVTERIGYLKGSMSTLQAFEGQISESYKLANSYWKRPGVYGGAISAVMGGLALGFGGFLWKSGSRLAGPVIALVGGLALTAGGVAAFTSHLEVVRARKFEAAEIEVLKSEIQRQAAELSVLQAATTNLLQSLN